SPISFRGRRRAGNRRAGPAFRAPAGRCSSSERQPLAALGATARENLAPALGRHARTKAVAALANELARLIGTFRHDNTPKGGDIGIRAHNENSRIASRPRAGDTDPAAWETRKGAPLYGGAFGQVNAAKRVGGGQRPGRGLWVKRVGVAPARPRR